MAAHHLQLLQRAAKRLPASAHGDTSGWMVTGSPAWHPLNPHLQWILPTLLQIASHFHALATPQVRSRKAGFCGGNSAE